MITEQHVSRAPWLPHLDAMDAAIARDNSSTALSAWRRAYASALEQAGWRDLVDVALAALRMAAIPGFQKAAESRARESYWTALFRARRQGSLEGVLQTAQAFAALGDGVMVEQCMRIAERLALMTGDVDAVDHVHALVTELAQRYVEVGRGAETA